MNNSLLGFFIAFVFELLFSLVNVGFQNLINFFFETCILPIFFPPPQIQNFKPRPQNNKFSRVLYPHISQFQNLFLDCLSFELFSQTLKPQKSRHNNWGSILDHHFWKIDFNFIFVFVFWMLLPWVLFIFIKNLICYCNHRRNFSHNKVIVEDFWYDFSVIFPILSFLEKNSIAKNRAERFVVRWQFTQNHQFIRRSHLLDQIGVDNNHMQFVENVRDDEIVFVVLCFVVKEKIFLLLGSINHFFVEGRNSKRCVWKLTYFVTFALKEIHVVSPYFARTDVEGKCEIGDGKDSKDNDSCQHI